MAGEAQLQTMAHLAGHLFTFLTKLFRTLDDSGVRAVCLAWPGAVRIWPWYMYSILRTESAVGNTARFFVTFRREAFTDSIVFVVQMTLRIGAV